MKMIKTLEFKFFQINAEKTDSSSKFPQFPKQVEFQKQNMIGCTEWLFFHIWRPDPTTKLSCPGVKIPNTVLYREGQPHVWYSTGPSGLTRKGKDYISNDTVLNIFKESPDSVTLVLRSLTHQKPGMNCQQLLYEYCDAQGLRKLIISRDRAQNMLLQQFIAPLGTHNYSVRAEWTPSLCVLTKRTNNHHLSHKRIPIQRRVATFEGSYLDSKQNVISPIISRDIELICDNIYKHIRLVTAGCIDIRKMILFFKVDEEGTANLLFCGELRVQEMGRGRANRGRVQGPCMHTLITGNRGDGDDGMYEEKDLDGFDLREELKNQERTSCINCQQPLKEKYLIEMKHIFGSIEQGFLKNQDTKVSEAFQRLKQTINSAKPQKYHQCHFKNIEEQIRWLCHQLDLEQNTVLFREMEHIPSLIIKIFGRMTQKRYEDLKKSKEYLDVEIPVCEECYTKLTEYIVLPRKNTPEYYREQPITNWQAHVGSYFRKLVQPETVERMLHTYSRTAHHRAQNSSKVSETSTPSHKLSIRRTTTASSKIRALITRQTISTPKEPKLLASESRCQTPELRVRVRKQPSLEKIYSQKKNPAAGRNNQSTDVSEHEVALETVSKLREWSHLLAEQ